MQKTKLIVTNFQTTSLVPYENNAKIHNNKQIKQIMESIKEFNFTNPILIDENNVILAGHGRFFAAQKLKLKEVPVIKLDYLSEAQKKAYRIADNKLTENGNWNYDVLKLEFCELEKLNLDFSLDITGFEMAQIDVILDADNSKKESNISKKLNTVPYILEKDIVSKNGDIWLLGNHKIICGNSLEKEVFERLFEYKQADMIFTFLPYNLKVDGQICRVRKKHYKEFAMASGEMNSEEFKNFLYKSFSLLKEFSKNGSLHYICMDWRHVAEIINAGTNIFDEFKNLCIWNKDNAGMGSFYRSKHELIFIFKNGTKSNINNIQLGKHGRNRTNVWEYPSVNAFSKEKINYHPTIKPVEMVQDAIIDVTKRGQIILDTFLGSGTTLLASEKSGRICYGIEIEPMYIDVTIKRWQELTGKSAFNVNQNKTYNELLNERKNNG